jgi:two-component system, OmpR family, sensor histidine kinase KdpD
MWRHALRPGIGAVAPFLWSLAAVALATIAGLAMTAVVPLPNVSMVLLLAVLFTAARFGLGPALLASGLSFLAYNFFFIGPLHTLNVTEPHEWLALCAARRRRAHLHHR